ncbi:hypothetical protein BYT27DRAFT_7112899, partial [Phlegmacium glaucopus]
LMFPLVPPEPPSAGPQSTTTSKFVPGPPTVDPIAEERRHHLLELTKEVFLDGKVPALFTSTCLPLSQDGTADQLPFIQAPDTSLCTADH